MKEKSFDRKNELLEAAMDEFIVKEYKDASLNSIIKNAGISKGTFYYHFKDKEALYLYLLELGVEAKLNFLNSSMQEFTNDGKENDIFELFKLQARIGVEFAREHPKLYRLGIRFINEKGNQIYETGMNLLGSNADKVFEEMIDKAIERGEFRSYFTRDFILRVVSHMMIRYYEIFEVDFELDGAIQKLDVLIDFMKYGLSKGERQ